MPDSPANQCTAHGCPLRATIFDSVTGPAQNGRCRYHDAANPRDWPYLTQALQSRAFTREEIEPVLASIGLRWQEPEPHRTGPYHSAHTGITVHDRESFKRWWALYSAHPPTSKYADQIGAFIRVGTIASGVDPEWEDERAAIQAEADPL